MINRIRTALRRRQAAPVPTEPASPFASGGIVRSPARVVIVDVPGEDPRPSHGIPPGVLTRREPDWARLSARYAADAVLQQDPHLGALAELTEMVGPWEAARIMFGDDHR